MGRSDGIIIVEDEPLIVMMVEQMVQDLGYRVDGCAGSEADALALLQITSPVLAILDVKLGSSTSLSIAAACSDRGIPVIFATGLPPSEFSKFSNGVPVLNKPFSFDEFTRVLDQVLRGR